MKKVQSLCFIYLFILSVFSPSICCQMHSQLFKFAFKGLWQLYCLLISEAGPLSGPNAQWGLMPLHIPTAWFFFTRTRWSVLGRGPLQNNQKPFPFIWGKSGLNDKQSLRIIGEKKETTCSKIMAFFSLRSWALSYSAVSGNLCKLASKHGLRSSSWLARHSPRV